MNFTLLLSDMMNSLSGIYTYFFFFADNNSYVFMLASQNSTVNRSSRYLHSTTMAPSVKDGTISPMITMMDSPRSERRSNSTSC
ncbi:hypothetical protein TELCIR_12462 [Teladorsagia circumcincta]|uniref:Uncharacterized protein n=1 Tax=Teladorsagia circumcincta TaxID=45464 RepID=A0A2G9U6P1_TELCI|nr:hypothetical protein TELCIR_12462 [Teladorsagia circumcincta]